MPHDVFISHSTAGKLTANAICNELESLGIRCWILPRDLHIGVPWDKSIANAVAGCRIMIVVFADYAARSDRIDRQLESAFNSGLIIIPFRTESIAAVSLLDPPLESAHWIDTMTPEMRARLRALCDLIQGLLYRQSNDTSGLNAWTIGHPQETRRLCTDRVAELPRLNPIRTEEQLSSVDTVTESPDAAVAGHSGSALEELAPNEQPPQEPPEPSRKQTRRRPPMGVTKALLITLTPLLAVLGLGFWHTQTNFKARPAKPNPAVTLPTFAPVTEKIRTEERLAEWDPGWGKSDANWSVTDGKLRITPLLNSSALLINRKQGFKDADVDVDVKMSKGQDMGQLGGLIFWAKGYNDCYAMVVSADGRFAVGRKLVGRWINPIAKTENAAVKTGVGQLNKLRIRTQGNRVTAYVNGTEVATLIGEPPQEGGYIGLYGESAETSQNIWDFANVTVKSGPEGDR
jgi:hypothetical protein